MTPEAIIIGFSYSRSKDQEMILGVFFDLFRAYSYCKKRGFILKVVTDIVRDFTDISQIVINEGLDSGIFNFIETIKNNGQYIMCTTVKKLEGILEEKTSNQLLVYYSGHCNNSRIILPDGGRLPLNKFKNMFSCNSLLFILDCCEINFDMPYKLKGKTFRSSRIVDFKTNDILCICSSSSDEKSASSEEGSLFTRACFLVLNEEKSHRSHIGVLMQNIQKKIMSNAAAYSTNLNEKLIRPKQTCVIYSSSPCTDVMYSWVINDLGINIELFPASMTILIKIDGKG